MSYPLVCILTAGRGTRMGQWSGYLNKALLPLDRRAAITHIVERFDRETEFVVAVGFLEQQVRDYLAVAHPERRFTFVRIEDFDGPGSGPGRSLLGCRPYLDRPFLYVSCDTLWEGALPVRTERSWIGVGRVPAEASERYCNARALDGCVVEIADKSRVDGEDWWAFTGLMYIRDLEPFWAGLAGADSISGEAQVSSGLAPLVGEGTLGSEEIAWTDIGNAELYRAACARYESYDFSKPNEALYFVGDHVIKFFADEDATAKRVLRASMKPSAFPAIEDRRGGFYAYGFVPGANLYDRIDPPLFERLLRWLRDEVWTPVDVAPEIVTRACHRFYHDKTFERVELYRKRYPRDRATRINGVDVPALGDLLGEIPWDALAGEGIPTFMHGDLHFDNAVYDEQADRFVLLDWRHDFAGEVAFGDLFYDLAKLWGGIVMNYDYIKRDLLRYEESGGDEVFDFAQRYGSSAYLGILERFIVSNGWSVHRVRLIVALIYLNMAPLHTPPFDRLLHALARSLLVTELSMSNR